MKDVWSVAIGLVNYQSGGERSWAILEVLDDNGTPWNVATFQLSPTSCIAFGIADSGSKVKLIVVGGDTCWVSADLAHKIDDIGSTGITPWVAPTCPSSSTSGDNLRAVRYVLMPLNQARAFVYRIPSVIIAWQGGQQETTISFKIELPSQSDEAEIVELDAHESVVSLIQESERLHENRFEEIVDEEEEDVDDDNPGLASGALAAGGSSLGKKNHKS